MSGQSGRAVRAGTVEFVEHSAPEQPDVSVRVHRPRRDRRAPRRRSAALRHRSARRPAGDDIGPERHAGGEQRLQQPGIGDVLARRGRRCTADAEPLRRRPDCRVSATITSDTLCMGRASSSAATQRESAVLRLAVHDDDVDAGRPQRRSRRPAALRLKPEHFRPALERDASVEGGRAGSGTLPSASTRLMRLRRPRGSARRGHEPDRPGRSAPARRRRCLR